jgi:hypothetical protein
MSYGIIESRTKKCSYIQKVVRKNVKSNKKSYEKVCSRPQIEN